MSLEDVPLIMIGISGIGLIVCCMWRIILIGKIIKVLDKQIAFNEHHDSKGQP